MKWNRVEPEQITLLLLYIIVDNDDSRRSSFDHPGERRKRPERAYHRSAREIAQESSSRLPACPRRRLWPGSRNKATAPVARPAGAPPPKRAQPPMMSEPRALTIRAGITILVGLPRECVQSSN